MHKGNDKKIGQKTKEIKLDVNEAIAIKDRLAKMAERTLSKKDKEDLIIASSLLGTLINIYAVWYRSKKTIRGLLKSLFGPKSEKSHIISNGDKKAGDISNNDNKNTAENTLTGDGNSKLLGDGKNSNTDSKGKDKPKRKGGDGRYSVEDYTGAVEIEIKLGPQYQPGKICPECNKSKLYESEPQVTVRLVGHAPVSAYKFILAVSRCLCGMMYVAQVPPEFQELYNADKYGPSAIASMLVYKYLLAVSFGQLEKVQGMHGVPLAASTQANQIKKYAVEVIKAVVKELRYLAANAYILGFDDTIIKLLEKRITTKKTETNRGYGTAVLSHHFDDDDNVIVLYDFDYTKHAGDVVIELLELREKDKNLPLLVSDGSEMYDESKKQGVDINCNTHARRKIVEEDPDQKTYIGDTVINCYRTIYINDRYCKEHDLSPEERMKYHLEHSKYSFDKIHVVFEIVAGKILAEESLAARKEYGIPPSLRAAEPNEDLYKIADYFLNRDQALTRVMYIPGIPLDTNYVEQAIKAIIRIRKNSLFFENLESAKYSGDILGLLQTTNLNKINVFIYTEFLISNREKVLKSPRDFLPWLYDKDDAYKKQYWEKVKIKNLWATNPLEYPFYERPRSDKLAELLVNE